MIVVDLACGLGITGIKSLMLTVELIQNITCIDYVCIWQLCVSLHMHVVWRR